MFVSTLVMYGTIALIDNGTYRLKELVSMFFPGEVHLFQFTELQSLHIDEYDGLILGGGHQFFLKSEPQEYQDEFDLIKLFDGPIFCICLGFEILCCMYGGNTLVKLNEPVRGPRYVKKLSNDPIFNGIDSDELFVYESHGWGFTDVDDLQVLASSELCVEMVKVVGKPIYGTQFHTEVMLENGHGGIIMKNFLNMLDV